MSYLQVLRRGLGGALLFGLVLAPVVSRAQTSGFDAQALVDAFAHSDSSVNGGKGFSESSDSSRLGWGESRYLDAYIKMYYATGNTRWLDRIVAHFDRMIANMSDSDGDGIPDWHTERYSVSRMEASALYNTGTAQIAPTEARELNIRRAHKAKDAVYIVERVSADRFVVRDVTHWQVTYDGAYTPGSGLPGIAGFKVHLVGMPDVGDKFRVQTWGVRPLQYAVHEGMILYPIARFIEVVLKNKKLSARYGDKARTYLRLIEERILNKEERYWKETGPDEGAYRVIDSAWARYPNRLLPHNQYLALGLVYLVLKDVSNNPLFLKRATEMARNFKEHLRETGDAYTWSYWDWVEAGKARHSGVEDTGHGSIDVEFAVQACLRGVVFTKADLQRFSRTLTEQMWNGSMSAPKIGRRVNSQAGDANTVRGWIDLCRWDPQIWNLFWAKFNQQKHRRWLDIPSLLYDRAVLDRLKATGSAPTDADFKWAGKIDETGRR